VDPTFAQYGALGVLATLAIAAVKVMFGYMRDAHKRETERADRLEAELKALNELVQNRCITTLTEATKAIADAMALVRSRL
jgi:hypothetical protein